MKTIRSRDNPAFRALLALAGSGRERRRLSATLLEGVHLCAAWRDRCGEPRRIVTTVTALEDPEVAALVPDDHPDVLVLTEALFGQLTNFSHGVAILYQVDTPAPPLPPRLADDAVYLDRLQDPGNVGTLLRSCAAAGIGRIICAPKTVLLWSPKVLRAGMGAHVALTIHEAVPWEVLAPRLRVPVFATAADAPRSLYDCDLRAARLWVFGNEGGGLDPSISGPEVTRVAIPQAPGVESLNVAMAATVCLFEQRRQRLG